MEIVKIRNWTETIWGIQYHGDPRYRDGHIESGGVTLGGSLVGRYSKSDAEAIARYSQYGKLVKKTVVIEERHTDWEEV